MIEKMKKLMEKKKGEKISPVEKDAKMGVLSHLSNLAGQAMSDKLHGLKKVSVASDSEEGLKSGIDKAKEIVEGRMQKDADHKDDGFGQMGLDEESEKEPLEHSLEEELTESPEEEAAEHEDGEDGEDDESEEEIDRKLAELMAKKKAKEKHRL